MSGEIHLFYQVPMLLGTLNFII